MIVLPITVIEPTIQPLSAGRLTRLRRPAGGSLDAVEPGALLWVREPFRFQKAWDKVSPTAAAERGAIAHFTAGLAPGAPAMLGLGKPRYARNLPRACHRQHLLVTRVAREPLQLITEEEMRAEGFASRNGWVDAWDLAAALGKRMSWSDNPTVLVIDFALQKRPLPGGES